VSCVAQDLFKQQQDAVNKPVEEFNKVARRQAQAAVKLQADAHLHASLMETEAEPATINWAKQAEVMQKEFVVQLAKAYKDLQTQSKKAQESLRKQQTLKV